MEGESVRDGLKAILTGQPDLAVVARAATAREGLAAVQSRRRDLVLGIDASRTSWGQ